MTGRALYKAPKTGQIRKLESANRPSRLEIHELKDDNDKEGRCGNGPCAGEGDGKARRGARDLRDLREGPGVTDPRRNDGSSDLPGARDWADEGGRLAEHGLITEDP